MSTQLTPPPITPGPWQKADGSAFVYALTQRGWRKGEPEMVNRFSVSVQRGHESTEEELKANAQFIAAAPQMADALVQCLPDWWREALEDDAINDSKICTEITYGDVRAIVKALQAAGYTESTADL
jgi:hypothetical protein